MASGQWIVDSKTPKSTSVCIRWSWWALLPLGLTGVAICTPFLTRALLPLGFALQRGFALVCHQRPERSLCIFGAIVAVCSRCLGIYLGAALGLLFRTTRSVAVRLLTAAAAINALDAATELTGLHGNWLGVRFALGLALGASAAVLISSSLQDGQPVHDAGKSLSGAMVSNRV